MTVLLPSLVIKPYENDLLDNKNKPKQIDDHGDEIKKNDKYDRYEILENRPGNERQSIVKLY